MSCLHCGTKLIQPKSGRRKKFCCRAHRDSYQYYQGVKINHPEKYYIKFTCIHCGKEDFGPKTQKFCSRECKNLHQAKSRPNKICKFCNKEFSVTRLKRNNKFCSSECANSYDTLRKRKNAICRRTSDFIELPRERTRTFEYIEWRKNVFKRDNFVCQCCGYEKGMILEAHHYKNYSSNKELRFDINNGITICKDCHKKFHSLYGKHNNDKNQFDKFLLDHRPMLHYKKVI